MKKIVLYMHGGSNNRGCEAIIRSTTGILNKVGYNDIDVFSAFPQEDIEVGLDKKVTLMKSPNRSIPEIPIALRAIAKFYNKLFNTEKLYYYFTTKNFRKYDFKDKIALSVGGDNYCYGVDDILPLHNLQVKNGGGASVLWGCSVEPSNLVPSIVEDMKRYNLITARESITYQALKDAGVEKVKLYPDPAFTLSYKENEYSKQVSDNSVGINISTYALGKDNIGLRNYVNLIEWIQKNTDCDIWIVPHVFKSHTNDMLLNSQLFDALKNKDRVHIVDKKLTAEELKAVIRKFRIYVGARTHSTIAAYSSCVPTLVLGYSIKAKGIAKDLFGTYENYVVSVDDLQKDDELTNAFIYIMQNEESIKKRLESIMPSYIEKTFDAGKEILALE